MITPRTEMRIWYYIQTDKGKPTQSDEVVEIMEDFLEEVALYR